MKPTIAIDFDGVLRAGRHDQADARGWVVGARLALRQLAERYRIIVYSCRCLTPGGEQDIWDWLHERGAVPLVHAVTARKPDAVAYVDDRAVRLDGAWDATTMDEIEDLASRPR